MNNKILSFTVENTSFIGKGWGNGYVVVFKGHPMYGKEGDEIPVYIHGGVTLTEPCDDILNHSSFSDEELKAGWVIGFDTCHFMDTPESWTKERVLEETENLKNQVMELSLSGKPLKKFNFSKC